APPSHPRAPHSFPTRRSSDLVSAHCGTNHHTIDLSETALTADAMLDLLRHFDQPFADTSFLPMYWISRAVRDRGIICTLSGDGRSEEHTSELQSRGHLVCRLL